VEFEVDREYVGRIVGSQGAGVNKIRDQLGVKVDFSDEPEDKDKDVGKKKKTVHQKSHVKVSYSFSALMFRLVNSLLDYRTKGER
jgi:predicted PilT family ATPase